MASGDDGDGTTVGASSSVPDSEPARSAGGTGVLSSDSPGGDGVGASGGSAGGSGGVSALPLARSRNKYKVTFMSTSKRRPHLHVKMGVAIVVSVGSDWKVDP